MWHQAQTDLRVMGWRKLLVKLLKKMRRRCHFITMHLLRHAVIGMALEPHLGDNWKLIHKILIYHGSLPPVFSLNAMD
jgi:hypothetical protein